MSNSNRDTTFNYWLDWLDANAVDHSKVPNKELIEWMNDMEEAIGEYFMDLVPDEWLYEDVLGDDDEWEDLPHEDDDHED